VGHALSPERSLHFWSSCSPQHKRADGTALVCNVTVPPVEDTLLREVDLRQLAEKAQLSVELVTMCLESASELQAGTSGSVHTSRIQLAPHARRRAVPKTVSGWIPVVRLTSDEVAKSGRTGITTAYSVGHYPNTALFNFNNPKKKIPAQGSGLSSLGRIIRTHKVSVVVVSPCFCPKSGKFSRVAACSCTLLWGELSNREKLPNHVYESA